MRRLGPPDLALLEDRARMVAALIGPAFDQVGAGFVLLGFTFGEGGFSTYLSNGCRSDVVRLLRATARDEACSLFAEADASPASFSQTQGRRRSTTA